MASNVPQLGIKVEQLAGGDKGGGLSTYTTQYLGKRRVTKVPIQEDRKHCIYNSLFLGVLALVAAGGGAALIAISGGPSNLELFYTGIALEVIGTAFVAWIIVLVSRSSKYRAEQEKKFDECREAVVDNETILGEMEKPENTTKEIQAFLNELTPEQGKSFVEYVENAYYHGKRGALSEEQGKVIAGLATSPLFLAEIDFTNVNRDFAIRILANVNPKFLFIKQDNVPVGKNILLKLFHKVSNPQNREEISAYARHPLAIAILALQFVTRGGEEKTRVLSLESVVHIFDRMNIEEKILFLKKMSFMNLSERVVQDDKKYVCKIVANCLANILTDEFAAKFSPERLNQQNPSEELKKEFLEEQELLGEIVQWPTYASWCIFTNNAPLLNHPSFIKALDDKMSPAQRSEYLSSGADYLKGNPKAKGIIKQSILKAGEAGIQLSSSTQQVFRHLPDLVAQASKGMSIPGKNIVKGLFEKMLPKMQIAFLSTLSDIDWESFMSYMNPMITECLNDSSLIPNSLLLKLLYKRPEYFKKIILTNPLLGKDDDPRRAKLGLELLACMGSRADQAIELMDKSSGGTPYFNFFANTLADEVKGRDLILNPVGPLRGKLIARFRYSRKMAERKVGLEDLKSKLKSWMGQEESTSIFILKPGGEYWTNFNTIAECYREEVTKKE